MAFSKGRLNSIAIDELLEKVSEAEILGHYLGIKEVPCVIKSPMRVDNHSSLGLYSYDGKSVTYRDFKTGDTGSTFKLLTKMWGFSNLYETTDKINKELVQHIEGKTPIFRLGNMKKEAKLTKSIIDLKCKVREWQEHDLIYWGQYGITLEWLKFSNTFPISHIIITKNGVTTTVAAEKYAYVYVEFKDGKESLKIYQPYSIKHKWNNNHDSSVWDLWELLPEYGEDVIVTSSRKDSLAVWCNTGIPSCNLQAESYWPKEQVMNELKRRFKRVWILYDNDYDKPDNPGRTLGKKLADEFGLNQIEIPSVFLSKDPSDMRYNHGWRPFVELMFKLIKQTNPFF